MLGRSDCNTPRATLTVNPNPYPRSNSNPRSRESGSHHAGLEGSSVCFARFSYRENRSTSRVFPTRCAHLPFKTLIWLRLQTQQTEGKIHSGTDTDTDPAKHRSSNQMRALCRHAFIAPARRLLSGPSGSQWSSCDWLTTD